MGEQSFEVPMDDDPKSGEPERLLVLTDEPAADELPGSVVVAGLYELLSDPDTPLPIALGVSGRFGSGKKSLLVMLEHRLDVERQEPVPRTWAIVSLDVSNALTRDQVWALLVSELYKQVDESQTSKRSRLAFRWRLERLRYGHRAFLLRVALPTIAGLTIAVLGAIAAASELTGWIPSVAIPVGLASAIVALLRSSARNLRDPLRWLAEQKPPPELASQLPTFDRADREIANIVEADAPNKRSIALMIEGLDQPEPKGLAERIVAIAEFRQSLRPPLRRHSVAIVIALDKEMVLASLEVAFGEFYELLRERQHPSGEQGVGQYIADAVDLLIALPDPDAELIDAYFSRLLEPERKQPEVLSGVLGEALTETLEHVTMGVIPLLPANPRAYKQFVLALRLQIRLAAGAIPLDLEHVKLLARWVVLRRRWPRLAAEIDQEPVLLESLEAEANPHIKRPRQLPERAQHWLKEEPELRTVLERANGDLGLTDLPLREFAQIA